MLKNFELMKRLILLLVVNLLYHHFKSNQLIFYIEILLLGLNTIK